MFCLNFKMIYMRDTSSAVYGSRFAQMYYTLSQKKVHLETLLRVFQRNMKGVHEKKSALHFS